jgi:thioredoxin
MDIDETTFETDVIARSAERPVVVDFWADWCGPCHALAPILEGAVAEAGDEVSLVKVDVDANPALAERFSVRGIPAVKAFRDGKVVAEFTGVQSPQSVAAFLEGLTGPSAGERLLTELAESGEFPAIMGPLAEKDYERALEWLLGEAHTADRARRDRIRQVMLALFEELGQDDPLSAQYRKRLAMALY